MLSFQRDIYEFIRAASRIYNFRLSLKNVLFTQHLADFTSWVGVGPFAKGEPAAVRYNLDRYPLAIKTYTTQNIGVWLFGKVDTSSGPLPTYDGNRFSLYWQRKDNSIWLAWHHTGTGQEFLPTNSNICWVAGTWRIFKLKRKLVINCNEMEVYEILYRDLFDSDTILFLQRSIKDLSKTVTDIWFSSGDSATRSIKNAGLYSDLIICKFASFSKVGYRS